MIIVMTIMIIIVMTIIISIVMTIIMMTVSNLQFWPHMLHLQAVPGQQEWGLAKEKVVTSF